MCHSCRCSSSCLYMLLVSINVCRCAVSQVLHITHTVCAYYTNHVLFLFFIWSDLTVSSQGDFFLGCNTWYQTLEGRSSIKRLKKPCINYITYIRSFMSSVLSVMLVCKHMEASDVDALSPLSVQRLDIILVMLFGLQPHQASVSCQNKQICNNLTVWARNPKFIRLGSFQGYWWYCRLLLL